MRIISQNGMIDVPYEMVCIGLRFDDSRIIAAWSASSVEDDYCMDMARYSSIEKAERAMEMLHEAYTGMIFMQNIEMAEDDMEEFKKGIERGFWTISYCSNSDNCKIEPMNIVFRFPQEDKIE